MIVACPPKSSILTRRFEIQQAASSNDIAAIRGKKNARMDLPHNFPIALAMRTSRRVIVDRANRPGTIVLLLAISLLSFPLHAQVVAPVDFSGEWFSLAHEDQ